MLRLSRHQQPARVKIMKFSYNANKQMTCLSVTGSNTTVNTFIRKFIDNLIGIYNYKSYSDLSQGDKQELTALFIEQSSRNEEFCAITETRNADQTINLFKKALISCSSEDNEAFLEAIKSNAVNYYESQIEQIFEEAIAERHSNLMWENNCVPAQHQNNGEIYWTRRSA